MRHRRRPHATFEGALHPVELGDRAAGADADAALLHLAARGPLRRPTLDSEAYSWREYSIAFLAARELPRGFVVSAGPSHRWRRYEAPLLALGPDPRSDRTLAGQIKVSSRHVELFGFMPEITLRHERRQSNLDLYDFTRNVAEIGVVRAF